MKFKSIEVLRVFAQFMVVGSHTLYLYDWSQHQLFADWLWPLMRNSTVFFLMMSGYLLAHNHSNFEWSSFIKKRFFKVVVPYLFCLIPVSLLYLFDETRQGDWLAWRDLYLTGFNPHNPALWFFPLMVCFYLLAPFSVWIYKKKTSYLHLWVIITLLSSLYFHRPFKVSSLHHSILYFLFPYYFGMWLFRYQAIVLESIKKWRLSYAGMFALVFFYKLQIKEGVDFKLHRGYYSYYNIQDAHWSQLDLSILQKLLIFILAFYFLNQMSFKSKIWNSLMGLSTYCFGIHLYHGYFISALRVFLAPTLIPDPTINFWGVWILFFLFSLGLTLMINKLLKEQSHWLLG